MHLWPDMSAIVNAVSASGKWHRTIFLGRDTFRKISSGGKFINLFFSLFRGIFCDHRIYMEILAIDR